MDPFLLNAELAELYATGRQAARDAAVEYPFPGLGGRRMAERAALDIADSVVTAIYPMVGQIASRRSGQQAPEAHL